MKTYYKILVLFLFTFTQGLWAQVQFESSVSRNEVPLNENVRIDFTMNSEGDNFKAPSFEGFRVVGGPINPLVMHGQMEGNLLVKLILFI